MRVSRRATALVALPALALADNVHLVDFPPRLTSLSSSCQSVYTDTIGGCSSTDFTSQTCSVACVNALQALQPVVIKACANQGIEGQNVIVAFLNSEGPESLCSNAAQVLGTGSSSSPSSTAPANTATLVSSSSAATSPSATLSSISTPVNSPADSGSSTSTISTDSTATSLTFSGTATASSIVSTATSTVPGVATSSGLLVALSSTASQSPTSTISGSNNAGETANPHTGGGSPFDGSGVGSGASSAGPVTASILALGVTSALIVATWW